MIQNEPIDAVWVIVPPGEHGAIEHRLLENNIPFLVEKPLGLDRQTADTIDKTIRARNAIVAVGYNWRALDTIQTLRKTLVEHPVHMVVGTWHGREWWGTGANRASKTLVLALAFRGLGLERVTAWCGADNGRSQTALERLGFVHEGVLRRWHTHHGEPKDVISYSMLREEWESGELARAPVEFAGDIPVQFLPL